MSEQKNTKSSIRLPLVLCLGLATGLFVGARLVAPSNNSGTALDKETEKYREVLNHIKREYVDTVALSRLVDNDIDHLLSELDPHSTYITAKERVSADEDLRGNFDGIGIEFNIFNDTIVVVTPLSGGPSEALGIQSGDRIIKVDDQNEAGVGITTSKVMQLLKGPRGTKVKVTILRKGKDSPIDYTITRDQIPQYSVDASYMVNDEAGYIKINRFAATTDQEFSEALKKLKAQGMKKLILDLQGNPGGLMDQAIAIADEFLPAGKQIVYTKGQNSKFDTDAFSTSRGGFETGDLEVLINEGSASASEIVTGALQDNDRALVVGRRSFGKGLVQTPFELNDGSELRLTISRYYTPSGRCIQKPYKDEEAYEMDLVSRYKNGEFFHADSVQFNDSLKYHTANGRTVYGGGGIMPDYFVPLDTTENSRYLNELYNSTSIQEYTFDYAEQHQDELKKMGFAEFRDHFQVTSQMLSALAAVGKHHGVKADPFELKTKRDLFATHVKALIARKVWDNNSFFEIYNQTNEILRQAEKLLDRVPEINKQSM